MGERHLDFRPAIGMRWDVTVSTADRGGELFETKNHLHPKVHGPPVHVHPTYEESFEVISGTLDVFHEGEWSQLGPGESASVPAGEPHTLRNTTDEPIEMITRMSPARDAEGFFRTFERLIREGKIKSLPPKDPRSATYAAMLFTSYPDEIRATGPVGVVFKGLSLVGRGLRMKLPA